ncbi:hypothetical protein [Streptomyces sp. CBMA152]|uniref:hypothetical protein n=1 Tax=Streptomyces sp. CBMA152 TaxID=1896312 RepID=UPI00166036C4|nr:hypothetical protein [Streptomyces sp. CBMA152]MBD0743508.1 hypothetical protein [Streptomyces sp. CBMA152]
MTSTQYTIATREDEHGVTQPDEQLWTPDGESAVEAGFLNYNGLLICGIGEEDDPPNEMVALGHGHARTAMWAAANAWLKRHDYGQDHSDRQPLPVDQYAVFLRHPHPDHPCGCAWDGDWRVVYVPVGTPGAISVTSMRRPGGNQ